MENGDENKGTVEPAGCVLCGAGMTLDAAWLHMAWLSERAQHTQA